MLLTFLYMIATIMQARTISFLKTHLHAIFKGNKNRSTIMLYIKPPQHPEEGNTYYIQYIFYIFYINESEVNILQLILLIQ